MDWLMKLDPNFVIPLLIGGATWLYRKVSGKKEADSSSIIDSIFETFAHELLDTYAGEDLTAYLKKSRDQMTAKVWSVLSKRGLPKNALTQKLVNAAIEKWSAWIASQLLPLRAASDKAPLSTKLP